MFWKSTSLLVTFLVLGGCATDYNRKSLEQKYPGFGKEWIPMGKDENGFIIGYLEKPKGVRFSVFGTSKPEDAVFFTLFTRSSDKKGTTINKFHEVDKILDKSKPTKFVIHGWMAKGLGEASINLKNGLLTKYDANVFLVDWNKIASEKLYTLPMSSTKPVGLYIAKFIDHLVLDLGVDPKKIHIIGHSLGAHVSGFAANNTKTAKLGRVTGLDPARPGFDYGYFTGGKLDKSFADFVDVIHTCAGYLGYPSALGHADFYPNGGGPPQPNCQSVMEMMEACSHGESWNYYYQSLVNAAPFKAYKCKSFKDFENDRKDCEKNPVPMGDPVPPTTRGEFYLSTSPSVTKSIVEHAKNGC